MLKSQLETMDNSFSSSGWLNHRPSRNLGFKHFLHFTWNNGGKLPEIPVKAVAEWSKRLSGWSNLKDARFESRPALANKKYPNNADRGPKTFIATALNDVATGVFEMKLEFLDRNLPKDPLHQATLRTQGMLAGLQLVWWISWFPISAGPWDCLLLVACSWLWPMALDCQNTCLSLARKSAK